MSDTMDTPFTLRSFRSSNLPACRELYVAGLLGGKLAENDTGLDIDDIESAYMKQPGNHFWVAELTDGEKKGMIIGMIGVLHPEPQSAEIRRLRVDPNFRRRGVGSALMEKALQFCQDNGYLKIMLDTFIDREPAIKLFEKFRFHHSRTRTFADKELLFFYLDLYTGAPRTGDSGTKPEGAA